MEQSVAAGLYACEESVAMRAEVYQFLAAVFSAPPARELVQSLAEGRLQSALSEVVGGRGIHWEGRKLTVCATLAELEEEFHALFVVPGPRYVPPYESVYLDSLEVDPMAGCAAWAQMGQPLPPPRVRDGVLWGASTVAVQNAYIEAGLQLSPDCHELPDHLGLELEFMAHLCEREAEATGCNGSDGAQAWRARQRHFLHRHLRRWLPLFRARLTRARAHPFYTAMALITQRFVSHHLRSLEPLRKEGALQCA